MGAGGRPRSVAGSGRAFGACCFPGKLRSPAPPTGDTVHPAQLRVLDPYASPLALLWDGVGSYPRAQWCMDDRGGHAGGYKRADRSVMGMLVSTLGLLPAATGKAAAPPRRQTVLLRPPVDRDMRRR